MRHIPLYASLLFGATFFSPTAVWAASDCGDEQTKMAEVVHTIRTPDSTIAPKVKTPQPVEINQPQNEAVDPFSSTLPSEPEIIETVKATEVAAAPVETAASAYTSVLKRRISRGEANLNLFDYAGAKAAGELTIIKAYTDELASQNPDALPVNDQIAYWANLYNALTVKLILEEYPVKSIRKVKAGAFSMGPWKRDEVTVNGKVLSLNDIEHEILRKRYANPAMVHYMVNCASIGCPNLQPKLWTGATLDADRDAAAREFINSPRGVEIKNDKLKASSIYDWFKADFGGSKTSTIEHYRQYAGPELLKALDAGAKIESYGYDWDLNE